MKKFLPLLLSALPLAASAQTTPTWGSAAGLPITPAFSIQPSYATDAAGNTYLAATFSGSATLATGTTITSQSLQDGVVAKYSPAGALLWYRQLKGNGTDSFQKVILDASGKVVLMGLASDGAQIGTTTFNTTNFTSPLVITQLDAQGTVQYIREVGSASLLLPASLAADAAGNYYVSGTFGLDATFGSFSLSTPVSSSGGGYGLDQYVAKVSGAGTVQWAQQGGRVMISVGTSTATAYSHLVADPSGNVYFTWTCAPTAGGFGSVAMPAGKGDYDGLVVKYNTQGIPQWAQRVGGAGADVLTFAGLDATNRLVVPSIVAPAGSLTNPGSASTTIATNGSVAVLEPTAGTLVWSRDLQATLAGGYRAVTSDAAGNIYLAGHFSGSGSVPGKTFTGAGGLDAVVVSYSPTGTLNWTQQSSGAGDEIPVGIGLAGSQVVVAGVFNNTAKFGSTTLTSTATAANTGTPFVAYLTGGVLATRAGQEAAPLALYPNPATTTGSVALPSLPTGTQLTVLDGLGRVAHRQPATATLPLAGLAPGLYVVQATAPDGAQWRSRLVVE